MRSAPRFETEAGPARLDSSADLQEASPNTTRHLRREHAAFGLRPLKSLRSPDRGSPTRRLQKLKSGEFEAPVEHTGINSVRASAGLKPKESLHCVGLDPQQADRVFEELVDRFVPCLLLPPLRATNRVLVFYHANAEDLADARYFCQRLNLLLDVGARDQCYMLIVEYPGYSLYRGEPSEERVLSDISPVHEFLTRVMGFLPEDLIVMGRSLGTGPATHFAAQHPCAGLVLVSPFTSIQAVVRNNYGDLLARLVKDRFNNEEHIARVACPVLFIHGKDDEYIPDLESRRLFGTPASPEKRAGPSEVQILSGMTHKHFDIHKCIAVPTSNFLSKFHPRWERKDFRVLLPKFCFLAPLKSGALPLKPDAPNKAYPELVRRSSVL